MVKLFELDRTATLGWAPFYHKPSSGGHQQLLLCTASVSGALDASFSSQSQIEIFGIDLGDTTTTPPKPIAAVTTSARFNRLQWSGSRTADRPMGLIAGGMEDGALDLWNPQQMIAGKEGLILKKQVHSGSVRAIEFNSIQPNLLATGSSQAEIFIWDMNNPEKPYTPGTKSSKLDDISCVAWNKQVAHILASASSNGVAVIWDLKNRREIINLVGTTAGSTVGASGRRSVGAIAWNPDNATQILTASEDDQEPVIYVWDLRNAHAPERVLTGHSKGILSMSWCGQDSELLMSSGKDNRTLCWNPKTGEVIGEFPASRNWVHNVQWCARNPDLVATASYDGKVSIYSLQGAGDAQHTDSSSVPPSPRDPFAPHAAFTPAAGDLTLKQPPKWLRRPCGARFGFGNRLISFKAADAAGDVKQGTVLTLRQVQTEVAIAQRVKTLNEAISSLPKDGLVAAFCKERIAATTGAEKSLWEFLDILQKSDSRRNILKLLGYGKEELSERLSKLSTSDAASPKKAAGVDAVRDREKEDSINSLGKDDETNQKMASLFGAEAEDADQFPVGTIVGGDGNSPLMASKIEAHNDSLEELTDAGATEADELIVKAIIAGDFTSATELCLRLRRLDDALVIGSFGGDETLDRAKRSYFKLRLSKNPDLNVGTPHRYIPILKALFDKDIGALLVKGDIRQWKELFAIVCTFATEDEVSAYCRSLGDRLWAVAERVGKEGKEDEKKEYESAAVLCLMASGDTDRILNIWCDQFTKANSALIARIEKQHFVAESIHEYVVALHSLVEKIAILRFVASSQESEMTHVAFAKLSSHYVNFLIGQGLFDIALTQLNSTGHIVPFTVKLQADKNEHVIDLVALAKYTLYYSLDSKLVGQFKEVPEMPFTVVEVTAASNAGDRKLSAAQKGESFFKQVGTDATKTQPPAKPSETVANPRVGSSNQISTPQLVPPTNAPTVPTPSLYDNNAYGSGYGASQFQPSQPQFQAPIQQGYGVNPYQQPQQLGSSGYGGYGNSGYGGYGLSQAQQQPMAPVQPSQPPPGPMKSFVPQPPAPIMTSTPISGRTEISAAAPSPVASAQTLAPNFGGGFNDPDPSIFKSSKPKPTRPQQAPPVFPQQVPQQQAQYAQPGGMMGVQQPQMMQPPPQQQMYGQPPPQQMQPMQVAQPSQNAPMSPVKPQKHPVGDRTHIAEEHMPIYATLSKCVNACKPLAAPAQKKFLDDAEKRLNTLYDRLNNEEVSAAVCAHLLEFSKAVSERNWAAASGVQQTLLTSHAAEGTNWILGPDFRSQIEQSLNIEELDVDLFRSVELWIPPGSRGVFGGQVLGQALVAATNTVPEPFLVHSLHSYFLLPGDATVPIIYRVYRPRNGKSFVTRTVEARQKGKMMFYMMVSFQRPERFELEHQLDMRPNIPPPEQLRSEEDMLKKFLSLSEFGKYHDAIAMRLTQPIPIEIKRTVKYRDYQKTLKEADPRQAVWMKATGDLKQMKPTFHQCVIAFASDHLFLTTCLRAHGMDMLNPKLKYMATLDHSMWFHAPFRADEYMLFEMESPRTGGNRGLVFGRFYNREGKLVVSCAQEGLIRTKLESDKDGSDKASKL